MTQRIEFSRKVKVAAFKRANGHCQECTAKLYPGRFEYDHDLAWELGGESTLENCVVRCKNCHNKKTFIQDIPQIAKSSRQRAKHIGAKAPKGRSLTHPYLKRKVSGEVVER
ncbi:MAG: HNH endonuclease [Geminicoccaceae bacterium]